MDWESQNLPANGRKFEEHRELMFSGPLVEKSEIVKISYHLIWVGAKAGICETFGMKVLQGTSSTQKSSPKANHLRILN